MLTQIISVVFYVLAIIGFGALVLMFIPNPKVQEPDFALDPFEPPVDRVFIVHFADKTKQEMLFAQIQTGPHFVSLYRADGSLLAAHNNFNVQSIVEK